MKKHEMLIGVSSHANPKWRRLASLTSEGRIEFSEDDFSFLLHRFGVLPKEFDEARYYDPGKYRLMLTMERIGDWFEEDE